MKWIRKSKSPSDTTNDQSSNDAVDAKKVEITKDETLHSFAKPADDYSSKHTVDDKAEEISSGNKSLALAFEELVAAIEAGGLLSDIPHLKLQTYPHKQILIGNMNSNTYATPSIHGDAAILQYTAFPRRNATQQYLSVKKRRLPRPRST